MNKELESEKNLELAVQILNASGVVAIPTETVYGLAARIDREEGLRSIFSIKERPLFDPLIVHIADFSQIPQVVRKWSRAAAALANAFWPGPLTILAPKSSSLNPLITAGLENVGVRMPKNQLTLDLINLVGVPLAAPSANKFKRTSPTRAEHVKENFPEVFILDDGAATVGIESTIILINESSDICEVHILRPGMISGEEIIAALAKQNILARFKYDSENQMSPGSMLEHYQPAKPLVIMDCDEVEKHLLEARAFAREKLKIAEPKIGIMKLDPDPCVAARLIYDELYRLSARPEFNCLFVAKKTTQSSEQWLAIWNRLGRAAKYHKKN